jgi:hypothetical protein
MGIVKAEHRTIYKGVHKDKSLSAWADQQGYILKFTHAASEHSVSFPGTITKFSDSHSSDLRTTMLYKETDPLVKTKNTMRKMSFTFFVANASLEEARYNEQNLNLLMCMMYPKRNQEGALVGQGTMLRVKGLGFIDSAVPGQANGVAIYISSLTYSPDIEAGFITSKATGIFGEDEIYPAKIELSIEGNVRIDTYLMDDLSPIPVNYPSYR